MPPCRKRHNKQNWGRKRDLANIATRGCQHVKSKFCRITYSDTWYRFFLTIRAYRTSVKVIKKPFLFPGAITVGFVKVKGQIFCWVFSVKHNTYHLRWIGKINHVSDSDSKAGQLGLCKIFFKCLTRFYWKANLVWGMAQFYWNSYLLSMTMVPLRPIWPEKRGRCMEVDMQAMEKRKKTCRLGAQLSAVLELHETRTMTSSDQTERGVGEVVFCGDV